jgi:hypothetical protein
VRAEFVNEFVVQAKRMKRIIDPLVAGNLPPLRAQASTLAMLFDNQHGLKLVEQSRDSAKVAR